MASSSKALTSASLVEALVSQRSESKGSLGGDRYVPHKVLSIQSSVVYGYVGNKALMPALQLHGFDVSPLNTVQFSNHTGYPHTRGSKTTAKDMLELIKGLELNGLVDFEHVLSGYMGSVECLRTLPALIRALHKKSRATSKSTAMLKPEDAHSKVMSPMSDAILGGAIIDSSDDTSILAPILRTDDSDGVRAPGDECTTHEADDDLFYVCDPVMADNGALYSEAFRPFVAIYRDELIPLAQLLTPNQTEASLLLDMPIKSMHDCWRACERFHEMGVRFVVITSAEFETESAMSGSSAKDTTESEEGVVLSEPIEEDAFVDILFSDSREKGKLGHLRVPKIEAYFSGTGDLTTALLLVWLKKESMNLKVAVEKTISTVHSILSRSVRMEVSELVLVSPASLVDIIKPTVLFTADIVVCDV